MAGIQSNGVGSGLDINGLVSQLVSAEGAPLQQRITRHEVSVTTRISALGALKGALAAFKAALEPLKNTAAFATRIATSADTKMFTVTAATSAATGHYEIEVAHLATAHQLASQPFLAGSSAPVGYGNLTISTGADSFDVPIDAQHTTLAQIRDAINAAPNNTGVQATVLNAMDGTRLVLTAKETGAAHAIKVAASDGDGGLNQLVYDPSGTMNLDELELAQNALIRVAGFDVESATNVFDDAIDGVTITAVASTEGKKLGLNVAFDSGSVLARIQKFVSEYNTMQTQLTKLGSYNAETKAAGALLGDSLLRSVETETRRVLYSPVPGLSGDYTSLSSLGITTSATGALQIDATKLAKALAAAPEAVAQLFGSANGVAARLYVQMEDRLATRGDLEGRDARLKNELKDIGRDKAGLTLRMAQIETRYRKQFTALDSLLSKMQTTSSYLSQQLSSLPKIGG